MFERNDSYEYIKGLVSIIIPAHQAEKFINRSVESAITQTYQSVEIIVVENGSTDKTLEMLSSIHDDRLAIYQSEKGVSNARNKGIKECRGEFICFLDADDWLEEDAIETLMSMSNGVDLVSARYYGDRPFEHYHSHRYSQDSEVYIIKSLSTPTKRCNCTANLYRTQFIREHEIWFEPTLAYAEDSVFHIKVLVNGPLVVDLEKPVYHVYINPNSVTRRKEGVNQKDFQNAIRMVYSLLKDNNQSVKNGSLLFTYNQLLVVLVHNIDGAMFLNGLRQTKEIAEEPLFYEAIKAADGRNIDFKRRVLLITLKHRLYLFSYLIIMIRVLSNRIRKLLRDWCM